MKQRKKFQIKKRYVFAIAIIIVSMIVEYGILVMVSGRTAEQTARVLLNQVVSVLEKNETEEQELMESLKEDYLVRAQMVSYLLALKPEATGNVTELAKIAELTDVDEIHLFNKEGVIYGGTVPEYYGVAISDGGQVSFFAPMLTDQTLSMCQDVTPNTAEGKNMMYAAVWSESGNYIVQIGIEPIRLITRMEQNNLGYVLRRIPLYTGYQIVVEDPSTQLIAGATDSRLVGKNVSSIDYLKEFGEEDGYFTRMFAHLNPKRFLGVYSDAGMYRVGVIYSNEGVGRTLLPDLLMEFIALVVAAAIILLLMEKVFKANDEKQKQLEILTSIAEIYYSMHLIDLGTNTAVEYEASSHIRSLGKGIPHADDLMVVIMTNVITEEYYDSVMEFTDLHTIAERMTGKKILTDEFVGKNIGWFRASFITIDEDGDTVPDRLIFVTQSIDEEKKRMEKLVRRSTHDELCGCFNRRAYEEDVQTLPPGSFIYLSIDVNELKVVNDSLGHEAGDELLRGAVSCMQDAFQSYGKIYRTGGDEFVVILTEEVPELEHLLEQFERYVEEWKGVHVPSVSVSYGTVSAIEHPELSVIGIAKMADQLMYESKAAYYQRKGIDRRGRQAAHTALCDLYITVLQADIIEDQMKIINMDEYEPGVEGGNQERLSDWFESNISKGLIHPEDVEEYRSKTDFESIRQFFAEGKILLGIAYRRKVGGAYRPMLMEIIPMEKNAENQFGIYVYEKCIDGYR